MMGKPVVAAGRVIRGEAEFALYSITTLFLTQHVHTARTACCEVLETVFRTRFGTSEQ
jgi:hypothetical protein